MGLQVALFTQPQFLLVFIDRSYGESFPGSGTLDLEAWYRVGTPHSSGGTFEATRFLLTFICHPWMWEQLIPHLRLSYHLGCGFFFNSLAVGFPCSLISGSPEGWLFCSLNVIWIRWWEDSSTTFTYTTNFTGNLSCNTFERKFLKNPRIPFLRHLLGLKSLNEHKLFFLFVYFFACSLAFLWLPSGFTFLF